MNISNLIKELEVRAKTIIITMKEKGLLLSILTQSGGVSYTPRLTRNEEISLTS